MCASAAVALASRRDPAIKAILNIGIKRTIDSILIVLLTIRAARDFVSGAVSVIVNVVTLDKCQDCP